MKEKLEHFYFDKQEPNKSCLLALRDIILQFDAEITETVKYGMPCFTYSNKAVCYLWTDKKTNEPYILMVDGNKIDHPDLEAGDRARMKILSIDPTADIPIDKIKTILELAIDLQKARK